MILEGIADNHFSNSEGKNLRLSIWKPFFNVKLSDHGKNLWEQKMWSRLRNAVRCDEKWAVLQRKTETAFIWECKPDLWEQEQDELFVDMTWRLNRYDCVHGNRDFSVLVPHLQHSVDCFCGTNLDIVETIETFG